MNYSRGVQRGRQERWRRRRDGRWEEVDGAQKRGKLEEEVGGRDQLGGGR